MTLDKGSKLALGELSVVASAISLNPATLRNVGYCSCNPTCKCETTPGCCEGKCPCHTNEASLMCTAESISLRPWEQIVRNEAFREVVASFDEAQVRTISDFAKLAEGVAARISGR